MNYKNCFSNANKPSPYAKRIAFLQQSLKEKKIDAWIVQDPIDLYYLTGLSLSLGQLWVSSEQTLLFVDSRYLEEAKEKSPFQVGLTSSEAVSHFLQDQDVKTIGFDGAKSSYQSVQELMEMESGLSLHWESYPFFTHALRKIKEEAEISLLKQSASLLWQGYLYLKTRLVEGITEKEVARQFEIFCLEHGAESLSFKPIVAFGENSAFPHYRAGERRLKKGDVVLIDIGVELQKYCSDMTRVVFFGSPDPLLQEWLSLVIEAQQKAFALCFPGTPVQELDQAARKVFQTAQVEPYFIHSLGHGIGLEVHEPPRIRYNVEAGNLMPGMVFTLEPGLYLPGKGGVRYEDMVVVTKDGAERLFPAEKGEIL
jgi:Xaa-Pro aminopeptidase